MNADVKTKWVAALRSGDYRQGRMALHGEDDTFCCLGVLCEIAVTDIGLGVTKDPNYNKFEYGPTASGSLLPDLVVAWAGLEGETGANVEINRRTTSLAQHNDTGRTFAQIADAIEAQL